MAHVKIDIPIPEGIGPGERELIANDVIEFIVERTQNKSLDKDGRKFAAYSKAYRESLDFELAGKTGKVNLTMTGDMLAALEMISNQSGKVTIGFDAATEENDKAEGNIKGTYGQPTPVAKPRNFMGISQKELARIISDNSDIPVYKALQFVRANYDNKQSDNI